MVNRALNELKEILKELSKSKDERYIVLGLNTKAATMNNIVKADEILILDDSILIQSGHLNMTFELSEDMSVAKYDYGVENEFYISNNETELYFSLMGA